jgi:isocitrate dehydrogenase kinase/phosphatase
MGAVGLVFAPLAPLVAVAAAVVLWIFSWVYKYQLMFVFTSKVESGGVSELISNSRWKSSAYHALLACLERRHQPIVVFCPFNASAHDTQYVIQLPHNLFSSPISSSNWSSTRIPVTPVAFHRPPSSFYCGLQILCQSRFSARVPILHADGGRPQTRQSPFGTCR